VLRRSLSWPLLLSTVVVVSAAAEERPLVSAVEVVGCERVHPDRIRFVLSTRAGQPLDYLALTDDVRAIERMGPFTGTKVEQRVDRETGQVTVVFTVTELPLVGSVTFRGLSFFQRQGLDKKIQTRQGLYLNPLFLEDDRKALERYYIEKGYAGVRVAVSAPVNAGIAQVVYDVDLGFSVKVGEVLYDGLPSQVMPRIVDQALINMPGASYLPEMVDLDQEAVARTLQDLGWLDARVDAPELHRFDFVRPDDERRRHGPQLAPDGRYDDRVVLYYHIIPGELWHLGSVAVVGNTVESEASLLTAFGMVEGDILRRSDIEAAVSRCEHLIRNMGYARCSVRVDRRPDPATNQVHLTLHVFEGDLYTIDRVDIFGNYLTRDAVIRRELRLHPGDLWNEDAYDRSANNVRRTGLFKMGPPLPVRLERTFDDDRPGKVDLAINLSEESTGNFRLQLGWSSSSGIFGELGYTERNFDLMKAVTLQGWRGGGQNLDVSLSMGSDTRNISTTWSNNHLWDGPYSLNVGFSRQVSTRLDWRERRLVSTVGVGRNFLDNDLKIGLSYSYTDLAISEVDLDASDAALAGAGNYHLNSLTWRTTYDRLDHPRLPTRGYRLSGNIGFTGSPLSATDEYWEYGLNGDVFLPITRFELGGTMYFHVSERWRQSQPYGDTEDVPFYDRYFGGGPSPRHRGFESGKLGPKGINQNGFDSRVGGTVDTVTTAELVIPVQGENDKIKLVVFMDYGNVFLDTQEVSISDMRTAIGFGVRFPIALPVALDFAWLLDPKDGESANQIHFALGYTSF
jgi:outer membrane protein insertion porin family